MRKLALTVGLIAHLSAWAAFLFLLLWPGFYSGQSETVVAVTRSGVQSRAPLTRVEPEVTTKTFSASIVEVNGPRVIPILAIPVALTAAAALAVVLLPTRPRTGIIILWLSTIALVLFSMLGAFSIGLFYFPAALTLILASIIASIGQATRATPTPSN